MNNILKIIIFGALILLFAGAGVSQNSFKEINAKSLEHYNNAQWDSVIYYGKIAKKNKIDYYYLSYRLAIANFYVGDYYTALYYFDKTFDQNITAKSDLVFIDFYYRALLYTKQYCSADRLFTNTDSLDATVGIKHRGNLYLSYIHGNNFKPIDVANLRMDEDKVYAQTNYQQTINTVELGGYYVASGKLDIAYRYAFSQIGMIGAVENLTEFNIRNYTMNQNVITIKPTIHFNNRNSLDLAFGYHSVKGNPYGIWDSTLVMDFKDYNSNSVMFATSYNYLFKKMKFGVNAAYSNFFDNKNIQFGGSMQWFPKGNLNLYSITEISAFRGKEGVFTPVIYQKVGGKIYNKTWIEAYAIYGNVQGFTMLSSNYSFEIAYKTKAIMGAKLIYVISDKLNFYFGSQMVLSTVDKIQEGLETTTTPTAKGQGNNSGPSNNAQYHEIRHSHFNIMGGLQWKF